MLKQRSHLTLNLSHMLANAVVLVMVVQAFGTFWPGLAVGLLLSLLYLRKYGSPFHAHGRDVFIWLIYGALWLGGVMSIAQFALWGMVSFLVMQAVFYLDQRAITLSVQKTTLDANPHSRLMGNRLVIGLLTCVALVGLLMLLPVSQSVGWWLLGAGWWVVTQLLLLILRSFFWLVQLLFGGLDFSLNLPETVPMPTEALIEELTYLTDTNPPEMHPMLGWVVLAAVFIAVVAVLALGVRTFAGGSNTTAKAQSSDRKQKLSKQKHAKTTPTHRKPKNPTRRAYVKKVRQHIKNGTKVAVYDTTQDIKQAIAEQEDIGELTQAYEQVRYGR